VRAFLNSGAQLANNVAFGVRDDAPSEGESIQRIAQLDVFYPDSGKVKLGRKPVVFENLRCFCASLPILTLAPESDEPLRYLS
jgi:hypothetical protein